MSITITPELQNRIDLIKSLQNITNVTVEDTPDVWKNLINNVDSVLFKISKSNKTIDLVVPKSICMSALPATNDVADTDKLDKIINALLDKSDFEHCVMCVSNEELETFYFLNPTTYVIEEIENVTIITQRTTEQQELFNLIGQLNFTKDITFYKVNNNDLYILIACIIFKLNEPNISTRYKVLIPNEVLVNLELHNTIVENIKNYYNTTVNDIPQQITL